jgi:hypothetical protein
METRTALELHVTEVLVNEDVTLVYMPGLNLCDFYVKGNNRYVVHFVDPKVFGQEFATIRQGNNVFNVANSGQTQWFLFEEAQLRNIVKGVEDQQTVRMMSSTAMPPGTVSPCTGPIVIPPRYSGGG